jgi:hypothetical protein
VCRSKHVEPSINFGIINSITKLHLVGIPTGKNIFCLKMCAVSSLLAVQEQVTAFLFINEAVQFVLFIQNTTIAICVYEIITSFLFSFKNCVVVLKVLYMTYTYVNLLLVGYLMLAS